MEKIIMLDWSYIGLVMLVVYISNILVCMVINAINVSRMPKDQWELIKMLFLPWLVFNLHEIRSEKQNIISELKDFYRSMDELSLILFS